MGANKAIDHPASAIALAAERSCLAALDGSCRSAIAIHAAPETGGGYFLRAAVFALDGSVREEGDARLPPGVTSSVAIQVGRDLGEDLRGRAAALLNL